MPEIKNETPDEFMKSFADACEPLVKWLNENPDKIDPHCMVLVSTNRAYLYDGRLGATFDNLVKN